eukprot:9502354-Pyramimonas_sp.AAC.1
MEGLLPPSDSISRLASGAAGLPALSPALAFSPVLGADSDPEAERSLTAPEAFAWGVLHTLEAAALCAGRLATSCENEAAPSEDWRVPKGCFERVVFQRALQELGDPAKIGGAKPLGALGEPSWKAPLLKTTLWNPPGRQGAQLLPQAHRHVLVLLDVVGRQELLGQHRAIRAGPPRIQVLDGLDQHNDLARLRL